MPSRLQRDESEQRERYPEQKRELAGEQHAGPEHRERPARPDRALAPLDLEEPRERGRCDDDTQHREQLDPEPRRERVVQKAVAGERIPALVPVVVPKGEAVPEEQLALVRMRRVVAAARCEPDEE